MESEKSYGPIIGLIIIILLIAFGSVYFLQKREANPALENSETSEFVSASDEVADIEAELDATSLEGLDAEMEILDEEV